MEMSAEWKSCSNARRRVSAGEQQAPEKYNYNIWHQGSNSGNVEYRVFGSVSRRDDSFAFFHSYKCDRTVGIVILLYAPSANESHGPLSLSSRRSAGVDRQLDP